MIGIDRHLVVLGCGLVATAMLAFGGGLATATWLVADTGLSELRAPAAGAAGDAGRTAIAPPHGEKVNLIDLATMRGGSQPAPASDPPARTSDAAFRVQVGSFLDQEVAGAIAVQLAGRGYPVRVQTRADRTGVVWYAPVVGTYQDRGVALGAAREVARRAGLAAIVVAQAEDDAS